ncbi:distal tail protein Dit [Streptococcus merionis]|uniref:distal tail protein Dit n=1 Tax=Streptococcus merionis TaxID=400065 RepID=UPI003512B1E5
MSFSLLIDSIDVGKIVQITNVDRGFAPEIEHSAFEYARRNGSRYAGVSRYQVRKITVEYVVSSDVDKKRYALQKVVAKNQELKLIFGDEPDRYWLGRLNGESAFNKVTGKYAKGFWTFLCFYPFALSTTVKQATRKQNRLEFVNEGTAETWPVYEFLAGSALKMIAFSHPNGRVVQYGYESGEAVI